MRHKNEYKKTKISAKSAVQAAVIWRLLSVDVKPNGDFGRKESPVVLSAKER